jgi:sec-independent protein translocase protein TatB
VPDISAFELIALVVLAVVIFGPERLPKMAADAGRLLRQARRYVSGARADLRRELGPEFADVNLSDLTPRGLIRRTLLDPDDYVRDLDLDLRGDLDLSLNPSLDTGLDGRRGRPRRVSRPLQPGERPPYDPDTT